MAATGTDGGTSSKRDSRSSAAIIGADRARRRRSARTPSTKGSPKAGQPATDDDVLGARREHEQLDREAHAVAEHVDGGGGQRVAGGGRSERVAPAAAGRWPQPGQRRARRHGLEAADLPARARHVAADGQVPDLAGRAVDPAHEHAASHDRRRESGAEVEIGEGVDRARCRYAVPSVATSGAVPAPPPSVPAVAGDARPAPAAGPQVVGAEGSRLDVVVDLDARPRARVSASASAE